MIHLSFYLHLNFTIYTLFLNELDEVLQEYLDVLDRVPGLTDAIVHKIDTGDSKPIRSLLYRLCPAWRQQVRQDISSLLEGGIIGTCVSPWASPIVPI